MIQCISNNFARPVDSITFRDYQSEDVIVLQGFVLVEPQMIENGVPGVLRVTVPQLSFRKSRPVTLIVDALHDDSHEATTTTGWIENGNQICFLPVVGWENELYYQVNFATAFFPENKVAALHFAEHILGTTIFESCSCENCVVHIWEYGNWKEVLFYCGRMETTRLDGNVLIYIPELKGYDADFFSVIYTKDVNRSNGSQCFYVDLSRGYLELDTCSYGDDSGDNLKFTRMCLIK